MSAYDMAFGAPAQFGGGGFGGFASIGMNALQGFQASEQLRVALRNQQIKEALDQFRVPAEAARLNNQFFQDAYGAQTGQNDLSKLPATMMQGLPRVPMQGTAQDANTDESLLPYLTDPNPGVPAQRLNGYNEQDFWQVYGMPSMTMRPMY